MPLMLLRYADMLLRHADAAAYATAATRCRAAALLLPASRHMI